MQSSSGAGERQLPLVLPLVLAVRMRHDDLVSAGTAVLISASCLCCSHAHCSPAPCSCRPGDPFFEQQQEEQRELAAMAAEAEPVAAPRPAAMATHAPTFGPTGAAAGGAIPGIGDAVAMPVLPQANAAFDVFSIRQQPYDERAGRAPPEGAGPAGGGAPAGRRGGGEDDSRRWRTCCCCASALETQCPCSADSPIQAGALAGCCSCPCIACLLLHCLQAGEGAVARAGEGAASVALRRPQAPAQPLAAAAASTAAAAAAAATGGGRAAQFQAGFHPHPSQEGRATPHGRASCAVPAAAAAIRARQAWAARWFCWAGAAPTLAAAAAALAARAAARDATAADAAAALPTAAAAGLARRAAAAWRQGAWQGPRLRTLRVQL